MVSCPAAATELGEFVRLENLPRADVSSDLAASWMSATRKIAQVGRHVALTTVNQSAPPEASDALPVFIGFAGNA